MIISSALIPKNDAARLQTLRYYDILNSLRDPVFGEFVTLSARIFSLPVSLIALVEAERVYYPANYGMSDNMERSRQEALCATAILHNHAVVYQDLLLEKNITPQAAQAVQAERLRFYAGAPLRMPNQCNVGSLCVVDYQPRTFSPAEQDVLQQLAALVSQTIVVRYNYRNQLADGEQQWQQLRAQLCEELQGLTALVRYLFTRYGVQVPVPADTLAKVSRRFHDLHEILDQSAD